MKTKIISLLFLISLLSCKKKDTDLCPGFQLEKATLVSSLDYDIINTIIDSIYTDFKYIHINQETDSSVNIENLKSRLQYHNITIDTVLLQNYKKQNSQEYFLSDEFKQPNTHLIATKEIECLLSISDNIFDSWGYYYKKYPTSSGNYIFHRPGFNTNKDVAIIQYEWIAGPQTGEGYIVVLEKINDKWKITYYFVTWVI